MFEPILHVPENIQSQLKGDVFEACMRLQGKAFRHVPGRKTMQVNLGNKSYFIKQHFGVGWAEIVKNLVSLKKPIYSAMTEVSAIQKLTEIGIPTTPLVAYGQQGGNPASVRSFVITEDLGDIVSLEDLCADWQQNPPEVQFKQNLIIAIAQLAKKFHSAGLSHRDFYLCHFVLKKIDLESGNLNLHLIDLHRMLHGQKPNGGAVMKDISGLMFSAMDCGFTEEDWNLFKQYYLQQSGGFWMQVEARSKALYRKFHSDKFQKRLTFENSTLD
jgi:heptose I phosphotransferase